MEEKFGMIGMDDSKSNRNIVEMIKKIALAIESKNTTELREIAEELESWQPRGNWDDMDVRTKVFVEHVLVGFARIQLGLDILDKGANELGTVRGKMEHDDEPKYAGAPYDQEKDEEKIRKALDRQDKLAKKKCRWGFDGCDCMQECCNKCGRLVDNDSTKIFKDYGICRKCYEDEPNIDKIYKDETIQPKGWDEREKRLSDVHKKIDELKKNFGFRDKKRIDWNRYHKKRRGRFKKDELSDEDKDDLK